MPPAARPRTAPAAFAASVASAALVALGLGGCQSAQTGSLIPAAVQKAPAVAPPPTPASPPAPELAAAPEAMPELPPLVASPAEIACTFRSPGFRPAVIAGLRLRAGGPVFARVAGGVVHVGVPIGTGDFARMDAASGGLFLEGLVARDEAPLFAAAAFPLGEVVYPTSRVPLTWREGKSGAVRVTGALPKEIALVKPPAEATRPCADLSLDRGAVQDFRTAAFGRTGGDTEHLDAGLATFSVFADPARPVSARVTLTGGVLVQTFARQGGFSQVGFDVDQVFVAGWVRSSLLQPSQGAGLAGFGTFGVGLGTSRRRFRREVVCSSDVPIAVEIEGERATVGYARAGTTLRVVTEDAPLWQVDVVTRAIHPTFKATLLARGAEIARCREVRAAAP